MTVISVCVVKVSEVGAHRRNREDCQHGRSGMLHADLEGWHIRVRIDEC
jgi:hypothetical protein